MIFESFGDLMYMDGHGIYVWISYLIAFGVVAFIVGSPIMKSRRFFREQVQIMRSEQNIQQDSEATPRHTIT